MITVSIVSHNHGDMVTGLVNRLLEFSEVSAVILTCNISEPLYLGEGVQLIRINNQTPKGFGANHNAAFRHCTTNYFCVLNPDVELPCNPFQSLTTAMQSHSAQIAAPIVLAPTGVIEDSVRYFPTVGALICKSLGRTDGRYKIAPGRLPFEPDWVAGMFMLFCAKAYKQLQGFDENYFLYYEDVDICRRAHQLGLKIVCCPEVAIVHRAQRASRKSIKHMRWHLASMYRFLRKSI